MKIGELAKVTHTPIDTIRYYEREALLALPARTEGNYRIYNDSHIERLSFIRHCRGLDMTLEEIRALLSFKDAPHENCGKVNQLLDEHIEHVAQRVRELKHLEKQLKDLRKLCAEVSDVEHCGILNQLTHAAVHAETNVNPASHVHGVHKHRNLSSKSKAK